MPESVVFQAAEAKRRAQQMAGLDQQLAMTRLMAQNPPAVPQRQGVAPSTPARRGATQPDAPFVGAPEPTMTRQAFDAAFRGIESIPLPNNPGNIAINALGSEPVGWATENVAAPVGKFYNRIALPMAGSMAGFAVGGPGGAAALGGAAGAAGEALAQDMEQNLGQRQDKNPLSIGIAGGVHAVPPAKGLPVVGPAVSKLPWAGQLGANVAYEATGGVAANEALSRAEGHVPSGGERVLAGALGGAGGGLAHGALDPAIRKPLLGALGRTAKATRRNIRNPRDLLGDEAGAAFVNPAEANRAREIGRILRERDVSEKGQKIARKLMDNPYTVADDELAYARAAIKERPEVSRRGGQAERPEKTPRRSDQVLAEQRQRRIEELQRQAEQGELFEGRVETPTEGFGKLMRRVAEPAMEAADAAQADQFAQTAARQSLKGQKLPRTFWEQAKGPARARGQQFADEVMEIANAAPRTETSPQARGARFGDKVFIDHVWQQFQARHPNVTRQQFDQMLLEANRQNKLALSRADLAQAMHPEDIARSRIKAGAGEFDLIRPQQPRATTPRQPETPSAPKPPREPRRVLTDEELAARGRKPLREAAPEPTARFEPIEEPTLEGSEAIVEELLGSRALQSAIRNEERGKRAVQKWLSRKLGENKILFRSKGNTAKFEPLEEPTARFEPLEPPGRQRAETPFEVEEPLPLREVDRKLAKLPAKGKSRQLAELEDNLAKLEAESGLRPPRKPPGRGGPPGAGPPPKGGGAGGRGPKRAAPRDLATKVKRGKPDVKEMFRDLYRSAVNKMENHFPKLGEHAREAGVRIRRADLDTHRTLESWTRRLHKSLEGFTERFTPREERNIRAVMTKGAKPISQKVRAFTDIFAKPMRQAFLKEAHDVGINTREVEGYWTQAWKWELLEEDLARLKPRQREKFYEAVFRLNKDKYRTVTKKDGTKVRKPLYKSADDVRDAISKRMNEALDPKPSVLFDQTGLKVRKSSFLEKSRHLTLPDKYRLEAIPTAMKYMNDAATRTGRARHFGTNYEILDQLYRAQLAEGNLKRHDGEMLRELLTYSVDPPTDRTAITQALSNLRGYVAVSSLDFGTVTNYGDVVKNLLRFGTTPVYKAVRDFARKATRAGALDSAARSGVTKEAIGYHMRDAGLNPGVIDWEKLSRYLNFHFKQSEFNLRATMSVSGKKYAADMLPKMKPTTWWGKVLYGDVRRNLLRLLAPHYDNAEEVLEAAYRRGHFTEDELDRIGQSAVTQSQPTSRLDHPLLAQKNPWVKTARQFMSFAQKTGEFLWDEVALEAARYNFKPLIRFAIWTQVLGELAVPIKDALLGREQRPFPPWNDPNPGKRAAANALTIGGIGLFVDMLESIRFNRTGGGFVRFITGPAFGKVGSIVEESIGMADDIFNPEKKGFEKVEGPARGAIKEIPYAGRHLERAMFGTGRYEAGKRKPLRVSRQGSSFKIHREPEEGRESRLPPPIGTMFEFLTQDSKRKPWPNTRRRRTHNYQVDL